MSMPATITSIQRDYFLLLQSHFQKEYDQIAKASRDPSFDFTAFCDQVFQEARGSRLVVFDHVLGNVSTLFLRIRDLLQEVAKFWRDHGNNLIVALQSSECQCIVWQNPDVHGSVAYAKAFGVYFDTVCVRDPLLYASRRLNEVYESHAHGSVTPNPEFLANKALLDSLSLLLLQPLCVCSAEYPVAVVFPGNGEFDYAPANIDDLAREFVNDCYGINCRTYKETIDYFQRNDFESLVSKAECGLMPGFREALDNRMRAVPSDSGSLEERVFNAISNSQQTYSTHGHNINNPQQALLTTLSRTHATINLLLGEGASINGDIGLEPTEWPIFRWQIESNARTYSDRSFFSQELASMKLITSPDLYWLRLVELDDLVRVREEGRMEELRQLFRISSKKLRTSDVDGFENACNVAKDNLLRQLDEHSKEVKASTRKNRSNLFKGVTSLTVAGAITIAGIAVPAAMPLSIAAGAFSLIVGTPSIRSVINEHLRGQRERDERLSRPIGVLWKVRPIPIN